MSQRTRDKILLIDATVEHMNAVEFSLGHAALARSLSNPRSFGATCSDVNDDWRTANRELALAYGAYSDIDDAKGNPYYGKIRSRYGKLRSRVGSLRNWLLLHCK